MSENKEREINISVGGASGKTKVNVLDISFHTEPIACQILSGWDDENLDKQTTLRDISIILYEMCGQGVTKNLSFEISKKLHLDAGLVHDVVEEIIREYECLSEDEARQRQTDVWNIYLESMEEKE